MSRALRTLLTVHPGSPGAAPEPYPRVQVHPCGPGLTRLTASTVDGEWVAELVLRSAAVSDADISAMEWRARRVELNRMRVID